MDGKQLGKALHLSVVLLLGCGHFVPASARKVELGGKQSGVSQAELQQDLQRFTGVFSDRMVQSAARLADARSASPKTEQALRRVLLYGSSALDIATGQVPEVNLLDMIVFITLVREAFEEYWLPEVFGASGQPMLRALASSEQEIWEIADKVMSADQERELRAQIDAWRAHNPEQVRVESVRLSDFSKMAGAAAQGRTTRGMLASVKSATKTADEALLLGERALFLAQRMPFLLRLQARVGAHELVSDSKLPLEQGDALLARAETLVREVRALRPLLEQSADLMTELRALTAEARLLTQAVEPLTTSVEPLLTVRVDEAGSNVTGLEQLVVKSRELSESMRLTLQEARALTPSDREAVQHLLGELDRTLLRWLVYLALLGAFLSVAFWGAFYAVKRATSPPSRAP